MEELLDRIGKIIRDSDNFLITTHPRPDGDAVGAVLAMGSILQKLRKSYRIIIEGAIPDIYRFTPGSDKIESYTPKAQITYDVLIALDCTGINRIGLPETGLLNEKPLINIDHHIDNDSFGSLNLVITSASSTCELLYHLAKRNGLPIEIDAAVAIYVGIITDTGRFSYSNTTRDSLEIAAELIGIGVKPNAVFREVYQSYSPGIAKLRALAVLATRFSDDGRLAWSTVTREMFERTKTAMIDTQEFSNIPLEVRGVEVAVMFMEMSEGGRIKVSFRTNGNVEVNKIASVFGGGGHRKAAGCVVEGTIADVTKRVLAEVTKHLDRTG